MKQQDVSVNRGLYFLRARSYDPALGRFLQQDPLPLLQKYAYVGNNPATCVDPSGLCHITWCWGEPSPVPFPWAPGPEFELPDIPGVELDPNVVENWKHNYRWAKEKFGKAKADERATNRREAPPLGPPQPPGSPTGTESIDPRCWTLPTPQLRMMCFAIVGALISQAPLDLKLIDLVLAHDGDVPTGDVTKEGQIKEPAYAAYP